MEKGVNILDNKIKVLGAEEDRAKKNIEREIRTREDNLKTINEIALQKDIVLKAKIEQNQNLKKNMNKITEMKAQIHDTLKQFRTQVMEKNKVLAKGFLDQKYSLENFKQKFDSEIFKEKQEKTMTIKVQRDQAKKKKQKEEMRKVESMKSQLLKELEKEANMKKQLEGKIEDFSMKETEMKAKLIETKLLDLNSKSMIDLGNHFKEN